MPSTREVMCVVRKQVGAVGGATFHILNTDDAEAVHAVHCEILHTLPDRKFMYRHDLEYFRNVIDRRGYVIGAFESGRLTGYTAFLRPGEQAAGYSRQMSHLGLSPDCIAESAGAAVHPDYSKKGRFTQLIRERFRLAEGFGYAFMACAVSPENLVSLKVLLRAQCIMVANHKDSDGDNYLLLKPLRQSFPISIDKGCIVELGDQQNHLLHLSGGKEIGLFHTIGSEIAVKYVPLQRLHLSSLAGADHPLQRVL